MGRRIGGIFKYSWVGTTVGSYMLYGLVFILRLEQSLVCSFHAHKGKGSNIFLFVRIIQRISTGKLHGVSPVLMQSIVILIDLN